MREFKVGDKVRHRLNNRELTVEYVHPSGLCFYTKNPKWRCNSANYILIEPVKEEKMDFEVDSIVRLKGGRRSREYGTSVGMGSKARVTETQSELEGVKVIRVEWLDNVTQSNGRYPIEDFELDTPTYPSWVRVIPAQAERLEIIPNTIFLEGAIGRPKMQVGAGMGKSIHLEIGSGGGIFSVEGLRRYSKVFASLADVMEKINEQ